MVVPKGSHILHVWSPPRSLLVAYARDSRVESPQVPHDAWQLLAISRATTPSVEVHRPAAVREAHVSPPVSPTMTLSGMSPHAVPVMLAGLEAKPR